MNLDVRNISRSQRKIEKEREPDFYISAFKKSNTIDEAICFSSFDTNHLANQETINNLQTSILNNDNKAKFKTVYARSKLNRWSDTK